ncbi:MAG: extracellular solute-binding protein [Oscillibacter sp.]
MKKKTSVGSKIILTLTMLFFYLPILYIIIFSFNDSRSLTKFGGFSLRWYEKMFADSTMMEAVLYTVIIAVIATVVATVVGTITAIGLSKSRKVVQKMVERINDLPVMNPDIVTAISLLMFFSVLTVKKGFGTLLIAHIMFCIPYVMLSVTPKLRSLDPNLIDAAMDLGATPFQALAKVIVPQIKPGIVSGALIAFTMSFDDFVISYFTTGNGVNNISILVYTMSKRVNPSINALSTIVILLITLVLGVVNIVPIVREKREKDGKSSRAVSRKAMAAVAAVLVLAVVGGTVGARLSQQHKSAAAVEKYGSNVLKLYLPGEYLGENVISDFEKQYGVRVIVENFDSNEMMYTKLMAGDRYDVIIPSDYMIERLMNEDFLQPLDKSMIPNMENMSDAVLGMSYDPDNTYSIPYFWGSVGLVYNHENVDPAVIESEGWEVLRNTDYAGHIYIYDSERDSFMMAFKALGYSMNTEDPNEINDAYEWLLQMNNTMSFDDFVISYFTTGNGVNNISILVYTMSKRVNPSINALSTIVILLITLVLGVVNIVPIVREKREKDGKSSRAVSRKAMAAVAAVLVLAVVGGTVGARLSQQHKSAAAVEKYGSNVLKLYLPGEYLGENVISDFEKQYGVRVIVENFDSNEMMYTKLMAGDRYDVIIPSDYMIERLMNEDFLQPLDKSMIPNMENMSDAVLGMSYDPDNTYSIPYFWGSVGLVYNHENVDPAVIESEGWEVLRNTDYAGHIYIYDSERDSFMMAFKALGYSMNTEDPNEINDAYEWLLQMNNTMSPVYVTDEVIDGMMNGYKDIAVVYSGDAAVVLDENEDMSFYMPSQGTNIWCDAMVIPQNAENPKLAHEFINYMLTYEAAFDNTETVGYTSPNAEVFEEMTSSEDLYADNAAYLPRSGYDKDEMFHDNQTLMRELSKLWIKVKAAK